MLSLKVKINLDQKQKCILWTLSEEHRMLYNKLLESVKLKPLTFKELNQVYKNYRLDNQLTINSKSAQNTCIGLINNIKSFYALRKKDATARFPYKFKSYKYFTSFMYDFNSGNGGFKFKNGAIQFNLLNRAELAPKLVIKLPKYCTDKINDSNIKTVTFRQYDNGNFYIIFVYGETESNKIVNKDFLSIDLGYSELATCYSNKHGVANFAVNNNKLKKLEHRIRYVQAYRDGKKKGSKSYNKISKQFRLLKLKQSNKNIDFQHKVSKNIIQKCVDNGLGNLIVGDIKVKKVLFNKVKDIKKQIKVAKRLSELNKIKQLEKLLEKEYSNKNKLGGMSKSTVALGRFKSMLAYKASRAGIEYHSVNEAYTSQQNCLTDEIMFSSDLDKRVVEITPGQFIDRDLNSAINIAKKVKVTWLDHIPDFNLDKMFLNNYSGQLELIA